MKETNKRHRLEEIRFVAEYCQQISREVLNDRIRKDEITKLECLSSKGWGNRIIKNFLLKQAGYWARGSNMG